MQCSCVWFVFPWFYLCTYSETYSFLKANSHIPCRASTMSLCKRLLKVTAQHGRGSARCMWIIIGRLSKTCPGSVSSNYHAKFQDWQFGFPGYTRISTTDTALSEDRRDTARHVYIKANSHIPYCAPAVPYCAVPFVKIRVAAGKILTAIPTV